jgi:hypothetical protein
MKDTVCDEGKKLIKETVIAEGNSNWQSYTVIDEIRFIIHWQ